MTVISLLSSKHSPGTTIASLALAYAWAEIEPTLVLELDRDGGDLVPMCDFTHDGPGLLTLAAAGRHLDTPLDIEDHCQHFGQRRLPVVPAPQLPSQMDSAIEILDRRPASFAASHDRTTFIDAGRFRGPATTASVVRKSDLLLVVMRPNVVECHAVAARVSSLRELGRELALLLVGERPYAPSDIEEALHTPVAGVIADDKRGVDSFLSAPESRFSNSSPLLRSARSIASHLHAHVGQREVSS